MALLLETYLTTASSGWVQTQQGEIIKLQLGGRILGLPMTDTSVVVGAVDGVIAFDWDLLCSASVLAPSAFIVSANRSGGSYQQPPRVPVLLSFLKFPLLFHLQEA